uniref:Ig-like domain-containing protein n=1 Tax=Knipowitschia caucasica TaxID=637954 RepID=A0AAV2K0V0_KNICA
MTFKFLGWVKVFLILSACSHCTCVEVSIPEKQYEVAKGSDITLPCSFSPARPDYDMFILKWEVVQENKATIIATFYSNLNRIDISPTYEGRTSLDIGTSKQALLHLTKMTMADNANYRCTVLIPGDDEGTPSATTFLLVLVAPSPPVCKIQGTVEYWHDITLTCMSEEGSPKPLPDWKSYSVENVPRPFPPKTTEKDGALSLFNISREMSGFYVCTSTNRIGSASCNLTLSVFPGGSMSGATAGIIGGVVAGLLLLAVLIFCCYRNKKKAKYTEGSVGEMEYHDGDIQDPDGGQEDRMSNLQDRISEQIQNQKKTGMDKRDEDIEIEIGLTTIKVEIAMTTIVVVEIALATQVEITMLTIVVVEITLTTIKVEITVTTIVVVEITLTTIVVVEIVLATQVEIVRMTIAVVEIALTTIRVEIAITTIRVGIGMAIIVVVENALTIGVIAMAAVTILIT